MQTQRKLIQAVEARVLGLVRVAISLRASALAIAGSNTVNTTVDAMYTCTIYMYMSISRCLLLLLASADNQCGTLVFFLADAPARYNAWDEFVFIAFIAL